LKLKIVQVLNFYYGRPFWIDFFVVDWMRGGIHGNQNIGIPDRFSQFLPSGGKSDQSKPTIE
jgi:hypothetical protein